jgi:hypothetical protein
MPNKIKYSATAAPNTLKSGNVLIGINDVEYGPTSATGFWNGVDPAIGGYCIYNPASNGSNVNIYRAANDTELIKIINEISLNSFTTAAQVLSWAAAQTSVVIVNRNYEDIVTNGLFINVDAGFTPSYPKNGSTWYDLSKTNNASLLNGMAYESTGGGGVLMDGGDEYLSIPYSSDFDQFKLGNFTIETFVRSDNVVYPRSRHPLKIGHTVTSTDTKGWSVGHQDCNNNIEVRVSDGVNISFTDLTHSALVESTYYHRVFTVSRASGCSTTYYLNNVLVGTHNAPLVTGAIYDQNQGSDFGGAGLIFGYCWGWRFIGSVNVIRAYNRVLTPTEIAQNFNAQKSRYGLI